MERIFEIDSRYFNSLSRIFTPLVLDSVAEHGYSKYLNEVCNNSGIMNHVDMGLPFSDFLDKIYNLFFKNYQNEYVYKNIIANKLLLDRHPFEESGMLTEFRVGKCRADVVILNGTSTVYEIKSQFDSFNRLNDQLDSYKQVFDQIYVVTSSQQAQKLLELLPEGIGLLSLTDGDIITPIRKSVSNKHNVRPEVLFDSLRKHEYLQIIEKLYGTVPNVPNTQIFSECKSLFMKKEPGSAHDITMEVLKKRSDSNLLMTFLVNSPKSLLAYIISNVNKKTKLQALAGRYATDMGSILAAV